MARLSNLLGSTTRSLELDASAAEQEESKYISRRCIVAPAGLVLTVEQCNEVHPTCGNCQRHHFSCIYDQKPGRAPEASDTSSLGTSPFRSDTGPASKAQSPDIVEIPESRERRLFELKLFFQYTSRTCLTFPGSTEPRATKVWAKVIPFMALENDALLYAMYALSALHLTKTEPHDPEPIQAHRRYLHLALRKHSEDITKVSKLNADVVCITSSLLRIGSCATLQERSLVPYRPPLQWLQMTKEASNVFRVVWDWIGEDKDSVARRIVDNVPAFKEPEMLYLESYRRGLLHLLRRRPVEEQTEVWDTDIEEAYACTVSYIGSIQNDIAINKAPEDVCRMLLAFPFMVPKRFINLIEEQKPRALVVLAYFFALLARFRDSWWIGDAGPREIRAIQKILPVLWQDLMSWPLQAMEEEPYRFGQEMQL